MTTAGDDRQLEQLLARIEELEQTRKEPPPFWRNTAAMGLLGGIIAIVPASLTAVQEYYQTEREVRLNMVKYEHERTTSYLEQALSPETTEAKQAQVLRFLTQLPEGDPLNLWAQQELALVLETVEELKEVTREAEQDLKDLKTKRDTIEAEREQLIATAENEGVQQVEPLLQVNQEELDENQREIEKVEQARINAATRAGEAKLIESMAAMPVEPPRSATKSWRIQIAARKDQAEIDSLAAAVSLKGKKADIYYKAKADMYYLLVGHYSSHEEADEHVAEARRYLGQGAWSRNIESMCVNPRKRKAITFCE